MSLGIVKELSVSLKEKIRMTNMMASISVFSTIFFSFFFSWGANPQLGFTVSLMVPIFMAPLVLNHMKQYNWAMNSLLLATGIFLTILSILFGPELQAHLFFAHLLALSAFLFRSDNNQYFYFALYFGLLLFIFGMYNYQEPIFATNFPFWAGSVIFMTSILVLGLYLYSFNQVIDKNEEEVSRLLAEAQEKNQALEQAQIDLKKLNKTLESEVEVRMRELDRLNSWFEIS
ncbi:MAG: hypothetical protein AAFN10_28270, partial [Bacteroidota bacterium]